MSSLLFGAPRSPPIQTKFLDQTDTIKSNLSAANILSNQIYTGLTAPPVAPSTTALQLQTPTLNNNNLNPPKRRTSVQLSTTKSKSAKEIHRHHQTNKEQLDQWENTRNYVGLGHLSHDRTSNWSSRLRSTPSPQARARKKLPKSNTTTALLSTPTNSTSCFGDGYHAWSSPKIKTNANQDIIQRLQQPKQKSQIATETSKRTNTFHYKNTNAAVQQQQQQQQHHQQHTSSSRNWKKEIEVLASKVENSINKPNPGKLRRFYLNVFSKFRQLEKQNVTLRQSVTTQDNEIEVLKKITQEETSKVAMLELDIRNVNVAAQALKQMLNGNDFSKIRSTDNIQTPRDMLLRGIGSGLSDQETMNAENNTSDEMIRQGLLEVFVRFDVDNDNVMSCEELNALRVALHSSTPPLTLIQFEEMCVLHRLDRTENGLTLNGFLDMYQLTPRAAITDLEVLGITLGPLLFPRQALMEATRRLMEAKDEISEREKHFCKVSQELKTTVVQLHVTEQKLLLANQEQRDSRTLAIRAANDQEYTHTLLMNEKMNLEQQAQRMEVRRFLKKNVFF